MVSGQFMFHLFSKYKHDIPKLLFQSEFKQILNNWIESISYLHYTLNLFRKNTWRMSYCLSKSFVYTVKYHWIQRLITEQRTELYFSHITWGSFFFFTNWMKLRKRFPPPVVSIYTMGGCLFFFLDIDTWTIGRFVKWEFCTLWLSLVKETKNFGFFWQDT